MKRIHIFSIFFSLALLLILPTSTQAQDPAAPPSITEGRQLWTENCAPCHGPGGAGDGPTAQAIDNPVPNFTDPAVARSSIPLENFDVIKNGRIENLMPPWGNRLNDEQIWDLAALVWYQGVSPQDITAGEMIYAEQCAACHGADGTGDGTMTNFSNVASAIQVSQTDWQVNYTAADVHASLSSLSDTEIWQALDYIRTFSFAIPQQNGILNGQAVNATLGTPLPNTEITLRIFDQSTEVGTLTTTTDDTGTYRFEKLPTDPNYVFVTEGIYQDVTFSSDLGGFSHSGTETVLDLNLYESTTSDEAVDITQLHHVIVFQPDAINVFQIYVVGNQSNQAYIGDENGQTFDFTLPENAQNIIFQGSQSNDRFIETELGYADTDPVLPGEEGLAVALTYDIPYEGDNIEIEIPLYADVNSSNILLDGRGIELESDQLLFVDNRDIQGNTFALYNGVPLQAGDTLRFKLNNISSLASIFPEGAVATITPPGISQTTLLWSLLGLGVVAVIGAGVVYPLTRRPQATEKNTPQQQYDKLLLTLARLDERFETGELEEAVYRQVRAKYKAQLASLMGGYD